MIKNFKTFLRESQFTRETSLVSALSYAREHCKLAMANMDKGVFVYRGVRGSNPDYLLVDPKVSKRKSANTNNLYNLILSNSPKWALYPPRDNSIICTTNHEYSTGFGSEYLVIMPDDARVGECCDEDLWNSFKTIIEFGIQSMHEFNLFIEDFIKIVFMMGDVGVQADPFASWASLQRALTLVTNVISDKPLTLKRDFKVSANKLRNKTSCRINVDFAPHVDLVNLILDKIAQGKTMMSVLDDLLNPKDNGFIRRSVDELHTGSNELWTDSKCLLISLDVFEDFKRKYNENDA